MFSIKNSDPFEVPNNHMKSLIFGEAVYSYGQSYLQSNKTSRKKEKRKKEWKNKHRRKTNISFVSLEM